MEVTAIVVGVVKQVCERYTRGMREVCERDARGIVKEVCERYARGMREVRERHARGTVWMGMGGCTSLSPCAIALLSPNTTAPSLSKPSSYTQAMRDEQRTQ